MSEIKQILDIANAEVGYLEKSRAAYQENPTVLYDKTAGAGSDNYTKYAKEMDELNVYNGIKQGYPWCNVFVDWCFVQSVGLDRARELLIGFSAGCTQDWNWFKSKGQIVNDPTTGDLVFFGDCDHIGIVESVDSNNIYTIEGNTSNAAELITNGGCVTKKSYLKSSGYIKGYARPQYDEASNNEPMPTPVEYPLLVKGSSGYYVSIAQEKLVAKGYRLPKYGVDSYFGSETEEAVKQLQRDAHIEVDGKIGKDTWGVLNSNFERPAISAIYPGYYIMKGQQGEDVRKVQYRLIQLGYSCGRYGADAIFGRDTETAVRAFQRDHGLGIDGIVGPDTWGQLFCA